MATYLSVLTWKSPWTEEPGGLQPMGSQGVGHDFLQRAQQLPPSRITASTVFLKLNYDSDSQMI